MNAPRRHRATVINARKAPVTFFALCGDVFEWGTADLERITPEDLSLLEQTAEDVRPLSSMLNHVGDLYTARKRRMRPQGASYKYIPEALWPLFDACGPKRETGMLNPTRQPVGVSVLPLAEQQTEQPVAPTGQEGGA